MTQEDKKLLLKDLSARLPYGVRYRHFTWDDKCGEIYIAVRIYSINTDGYVKNCYDDETVYIDNVRPYLFPISSMSEEEAVKYITLTHYNTDDNGKPYRELTVEALDWLLLNHFDFRGLISMGLAIDATGLNVY